MREFPTLRQQQELNWAALQSFRTLAGKVLEDLQKQYGSKIDENETENSLSEKILIHEHKILPQTLQLLCSNKIILEGRKVRIKSD